MKLERSVFSKREEMKMMTTLLMMMTGYGKSREKKLREKRKRRG